MEADSSSDEDKQIANKSKLKGAKKEKAAEPLTKRQELNEHIVDMRQCVRQARVQTINRLVNQIKRYRNRKGNSKEQEKAQRRAKKILEEIQILKKIKDDKVSLYALQDTQELNAVLNNPETSTEERVLARLSHHRVITRDVKKYRKENPNWDKQIPVLLRMTLEKRQKKKSKNPLETPEVEKKPTKKELRASDEDEDESKTISDSDSTVGSEEESETDETKEQRGVEVKESEEEESEDEEENSGNEKESEEEENSDNEEESEEEESSEDEEESEDEEKVEKPTLKRKPQVRQKEQVKGAPLGKPSVNFSNSKVPAVNKSEGTVKVKFLTDLNELEDDNADEIVEKLAVDITRAPKANKRKSAFFVGGVDEPESDPEEAAPKRNPKSFQNSSYSQNQNHHFDQSSKPVYKKGKLVSRPPLPNNRSHGKFSQNRSGPTPYQQGRADNRFGGNTEPLGAKRPKYSGNSSFQEERLLKAPQRESATVAPAEKLHPSWEAKKKQQQISLTDFKGKKIVFDDD